MEINADFSAPVLVRTGQLDWQASPMPGVDRRMLDRIGGEVARATSIVRYAPGSAFSRHTHSGGEEFIVLEGTFQDEHGDYPAGTYVRNPIGTHHVPRSDHGCTIFVKLWQFAEDDDDQFALDLSDLEFEEDNDQLGRSIAKLVDRPDERVTVERFEGGTRIAESDEGGTEVLVLSGSIEYDGRLFEAQDWLRIPPRGTANLVAGENGARLWIKRGHLLDIRIPDQS